MIARTEKNFVVETFDLKSDRDERWHELATRRNDDGTVGRPGLVRFSCGEWVTVSELRRFPAKAPIGGKGPSCGFVVHQANVDETIPVYAIGFPVRMSARRRSRVRDLIRTGPCPQKQRRARYWRRHPALHAKLLARKQESLARKQKSFVVPQRTVGGRVAVNNA